MKWFFAAVASSLLLMGCQSEGDRKREICAQYSARLIERRTAMIKLGLEGGSLYDYCEFYKS